MIALTMSLSFFFNALTALFLETPACVMTSSISLSSTPVASTSSSSDSSISGCCGLFSDRVDVVSGALNFSAAYQ